MKVIVACEFSGIVRDAFIEAGHDAVSCDLLPSESDKGPHIQADIRTIGISHYDLMIAHPPCTHLAVSGARWFEEKKHEQLDALAFVEYLMYAPVPRIALENPVSIISSKIRKADQIIQPWQYGHQESKAICLWLKNLPQLIPTDVVEPDNDEYDWEQKVHRASPGPDRWKVRSRFYTGVAKAMAEQWGSL